MTLKANSVTCCWKCMRVVMTGDELTSRGVVGNLRDGVLGRFDGLRGGSVARPAIAPSLVQCKCQCVLHETSKCKEQKQSPPDIPGGLGKTLC